MRNIKIHFNSVEGFDSVSHNHIPIAVSTI